MARRKRGLQSQLWYAKRDARKRGLAWNISDKRAMKLMQQCCFWCGAPPSPFNGLDRIDNGPSYHARSTCSCCWRCNKAKGTMTAKDWIRFCASVVARRFAAVRDGEHLLTMFP